jgi:hypothetical protein
MPKNAEPEKVCSFCGAREDEAERRLVIVGPSQKVSRGVYANVAICSECVGLCSEIVDEFRDDPPRHEVHWARRPLVDR